MRHFEVSRPVDWRLPSGSETRQASFLVICDAAGILALTLIRVQGEAVSFGRRDALLFEQPVGEWEAAAEASLQAVPHA